MQKGSLGGRLARSCLAVAAATSSSSAGVPVNEPLPRIPDVVISGLDSGLLWVLESGPIWSGHGTLKPCVVCGLKIADHEIQYDVVGPRGSLPVHVKCYHIWRAKSDNLRRST